MKKILFLIVVMFISVACKNAEKSIPVRTVSSGEVFGTYYNIQVFEKGKLDYQKQYDSLFAEVNQSMSTYSKTSDITKINKGDTEVVIDEHFKHVFKVSKKIYKASLGLFDPTIGVLVNAWDFGPEGKINQLDSLKIDNLMQSVGFDKVHLVSGRIQKQKNTFIDFNAIAKGYGLDLISNFLSKKGHQNYLIDIGGEIVAHGENLIKQKAFSVGIEDPNFDGSSSQHKIISLHNEAMATSGVYRKFKIDANGNKYAHIINPKTGYPSKTNVLSVSVIAPTCTIADGFATAFKAMGIEKVKQILPEHPELKVYFIYEDEKQQLQTLSLNGFPK